jgi:simple sugar transport system substrate-binding protein
VIAVNVKDPRPRGERIPYLFYIGGDEALAGVQAAERVLATRKPKRALCLIQEAGNDSLMTRCKSFNDTLKAAGVATELITIPGGNPTQSAETIRGFYRSHPDTEATFAPGPLAATPAMEVIRDLGLKGKMTLMAFDLRPDILEGIKDGVVIGTIDQQQYLQGYLAVQFLAFHKRYGYTLGADINTGPSIVDASNVGLVEDTVAKKFR